MTSKEALNELCNYANSDVELLERIVNEYKEGILKDLEVLELLKPIIKASVRMSDLGISNSELSLNIKANKLLKEWLENDK